MEIFPMMGRNDKPQKPLFYAFNLDELLPQDHLLRKIDHFLDLSDLHQHLAPYYSHTGRPSVDPKLMIRKPAGRRHPLVRPFMPTRPTTWSIPMQAS